MDSMLPGTLLDRRYRLVDRIGVGGMSVIWRAHDDMLDRGVAVKVLADDLAADSRFRELVRTEARAAAALVHPHVTATYDYGETISADGAVTAYVVMELLEGESLSARLTEGPLPWPEALRVCAEVADALAAAHRHGIVHRDVTADNVMLTGTGAKVMDFGIATTVGAPDDDPEGLTFGTPAYVAPERLDGRRARPANDTYALGVLLFETLTGQPPFPAETWEELAENPRGEPPPLAIPGLAPAVEQLYRECLSVDPRQRPTAHQVGWTLRRHLPGAGRRARRPLLQRSLAAAGVAAALAVGVAIGAALVSPDSPDLAGPTDTPDRSHGPYPSAAAPKAPTPDPDPDPDPDPLVPGRPGLPGPPAAIPDPGAGTGTGGDPPAEPVTLDTIAQLVADGHAAGDITDDVADDLQQEIANLQRNVDTGGVDLAAGAAHLQSKVDDWQREGSVGEASAAQLASALEQLATQV